jgi:beta-glucosidase
MGLAAQVGLAKDFTTFEPLRKDSILDGFAAGLRSTFLNWHMLNSIRAGVIVRPFGFNEYVPEMERSLDFIGVNWCMPQAIRFRPGRPRDFLGESSAAPGSVGSSSGPEIDREGLYKILGSVSRFGKPLYITENGGATDDPDERCRLMVSHLKQVYDAIQSGGDVRGYFFRLARDDADVEGQLYSRICGENGLPVDLVQRYCPDAVW